MTYAKLFMGVVVASASISLHAEHHSPSLGGVWHVSGTLPDGGGTSKSTLTIKKEQSDWTAVTVNEEGVSTPIDRVKIDGESVQLEIDGEQNGETGVIGAKAKFNDKGILVGNWYIRGSDGTEYASEPWKAARSLAPELAGSWDIVAKTDEGDNEHQIDFIQSVSGFAGTAKNDNGSTEFTQVKVDKNELSLVLPFGEGTVKVAAVYQNVNTLAGEWTYLDSLDVEAATGEWSASKNVPGAEIVGEWALELSIGDNVLESALTVTRDGDGFEGVYNSPRSGITECDRVTFSDGKLLATMSIEIQGNDVEFVLNAALDDGEELSGTMVAKGYEDQFSAQWTATRK
jgi:hypothetical protein